MWGIHRDWWIPRTKGQLRGKCFHLMTSSCNMRCRGLDDLWGLIMTIKYLLPLNSLRPSDAYICVSEIPNIGSDNGLSPGRRQAIIWTNVGLLLIRTLRTNFVELLREIHTFSFKKMHLKMSSGKRRPFCLGLNVLTKRWPGITFLRTTSKHKIYQFF